MNKLEERDLAIDIYGDVSIFISLKGFLSLNQYHTILDKYTDGILNPHNNNIRTEAHALIASDFEYVSNGITYKL